MAQLTEIQTIRFSKDNIDLINLLKSYGVKPDSFIRQAFIEKIERDMPVIIKKHTDSLNQYVPF